MSHLVIIDGHAIAHRAYHSIPPLSVDGQPVNALYGFFSMVLSAVDALNPDYLIVCLDSPGPNFRNQEFVGYRAQRKPADVDLKSQLPLIPEALKVAHISHYSMGGFEADDLIGTIARRSLRRHQKNKKLISRVTIITGDKDLMQLVDDRVSLFVPVQGLSVTKLYDSAAVKDKLGVYPSQVIDLKALMGDMSDNYPGVEGVGPVAATSLLEKYRTLDNLYHHLEEVKPTLRDKLVKDKDNAYLSQKLATIVTNIPLKFTLHQARWRHQNLLGLKALFDQYHFKSLASRLVRRYPKAFSLAKPIVESNQTRLF